MRVQSLGQILHNVIYSGPEKETDKWHFKGELTNTKYPLSMNFRMRMIYSHRLVGSKFFWWSQTMPDTWKITWEYNGWNVFIITSKINAILGTLVYDYFPHSNLDIKIGFVDKII